MSTTGSTEAHWRLRAPRLGGSECAGRGVRLKTRERVAIDRDRVSPDSCVEEAVVGRGSGWRHNSPATGLRKRREGSRCRAFSELTGVSWARSYADARRHNPGVRKSADDHKCSISATYLPRGNRGWFEQISLFSDFSRVSGQESPELPRKGNRIRS